MNKEEWRPIQNFSRYLISNYGRVWNRIFEMMMKTSRARPNKTTQGEGYVKISLIGDDEVRHTLSVAVLVAQAFVDPPNPRSCEVILLDGDLGNVAASNLAWRTPRQAWLYRRQMVNSWKPNWTNLPVLNQTTG